MSNTAFVLEVGSKVLKLLKLDGCGFEGQPLQILPCKLKTASCLGAAIDLGETPSHADLQGIDFAEDVSQKAHANVS